MQVLYKHKELGEVLVTFKSNARKFIARWGTNRVDLTAPAVASHKDVLQALDSMAPRLLTRKPAGELCFRDGQTINLYGVEVVIERQSHKPDAIFASQSDPGRATVSVGSDFDISSDIAAQMISKALRVVARRNASLVLLPRAKELAASLGCHPSGWQISSGMRILGQCNAAGIIKLSYMNMFLTPELRDYIICHELAHLTELNHSPRFHAVCDGYLNGREKELIAKLKNYNWPLRRK